MKPFHVLRWAGIAAMSIGWGAFPLGGHAEVGPISDGPARGAQQRPGGSIDKVSLRESTHGSSSFKVPAPWSGAVPAAEPHGGQVRIGASCSLNEVPADILAQINAVRTAGRSCGTHKFGAAAALVWNERLFSAAVFHSADMARRDFFDHVTPEGTDWVQRIEAAGYGWSRAGENIAAGNATVEAVMTAWLESDNHCRNILNPAFTEVAVACVAEPASSYGTYWTMVLGRALPGEVTRRSPASAPSHARGPAPAVAGAAPPPARP